jgi:DNA invertase Pin-like site-specific DNA recombinase
MATQKSIQQSRAVEVPVHNPHTQAVTAGGRTERAGAPMRVVLYSRVSTLNLQDPELQARELREYAQRRGWQIVREYVDRGVSGSKDSRPALNELLADVHQRKCDVVLVWKLDRLGRSLRHLVNTLAELEARGVAFVSLRDNLDLSTPSGRLMFNVIGAMAEFERALIQERVKAGLRNARAKGKRLGRPRVAADGHQVVGLRKAGNSWSSVCEQTGLSKGTAQRAFCAQKNAPSLPKNRRGPISSTV